MGQKSERGRLLNAALGEPEKAFVFWRASLLPGDIPHGFIRGWHTDSWEGQVSNMRLRVSETLGVQGPVSIREPCCAPSREAGLTDFYQAAMGLYIVKRNVKSRFKCEILF